MRLIQIKFSGPTRLLLLFIIIIINIIINISCHSWSIQRGLVHRTFLIEEVTNNSTWFSGPLVFLQLSSTLTELHLLALKPFGGNLDALREDSQINFFHTNRHLDAFS